MLTPSQESALDLNRHTAIIANAGSGKTRVLVDRYLKILETNRELHPRNIAAITFTDASARDLKKKIVDAVHERLTNCENGRERDRLLEIRRQISGANISTIHSFCIQLLRTYPVEANVDASFTILTSPEDQLLREECVQSSFYKILKAAYASENLPEAKLLPIFQLFGRRKITSLVYSLLASRFKVKSLAEAFYSKDNNTILTYWDKMIASAIKTDILGTIDTSFFTRLLDEKTTQGKKRANAEAAVSSYLIAKSDIEKLSGYKELIDTFYTDKFLLSGSLFSKDTRANFKIEAEVIVAPHVKYKRLIDSLIESKSLNDELYLNYCRQLLEIYSYALDNYTEQKIHYSFLDYDDVIEKALHVVQIPEVQSELVRRFAHILIDEYQDTDAAQYEIARSLTGSFQEANRLTVVGDPKQSIYSFRNADLDLYLDTIKEISSAHHDNKPVTLSETFRMLEYPLAFINKVSEHLFPDDPAKKSEYKFTPLVEGRNDAKTGSVEFILPIDSEYIPVTFEENDEEEELEDPISINEVELIALKIKSIISDREEKYSIRGKDTSEPPSYKDIAILLRSRTHQGEIETELRRKHIPFVTYGGKGFYSQPEIIDITNYLRFLVNPNDDIALAGILRSPYFGLSDVDLYRLAPEYNSTTNLWQRFSLSFQDERKKYFTRAFNQLSENLQLVGRVSTQFLLQKIIRETGILGVLESLPGAEQKIANLEKFQRFALSFGSEGYSGTFDFIERISLLMERDEMEAQAEPQTDLNAVHIMTIHNAKGLEFPIVFLPYLHTSLYSRDARRTWNTLDKELGIGIDLPDLITKQPIVELIKIRSREKEIEEEKRIFYVAMTRARDHLILSASPRKNYKNTRMGWVLKSLEIGHPDEFANIDVIPFNAEITRYRSDKDNTADIVNFSIPIISRTEDISVIDAGEDEHPSLEKEPQFLLEDVEPSESVGRYSPSQLLTFLECPTKYYLRYQLGLPEEARLPYYNEADILAENVQGSLFGQILHKVLEKSNLYFFNEFYDEKLLDEVFHSVCNDLHLAENAKNKYRKRFAIDIKNILSTSIGREALSSKEFRTEFALRSQLPNGQVLSGIIDRLYRDNDGKWNILDYKTDTRENSEKKKRYEFQLKFYAYLVSLLYSQDSVNAHILYTHSGNSLSFTFSKKDFSRIGAQLESLVAEIREQKKIESLDGPVRNLRHCSECPYFNKSENLCIAGVGNQPIPLQTELFFA